MTRELADPPRLLVTGFGPFPGADQNPTAELIDWLAGQPQGASHSSAEIATAIFPTEWSTLADLHAQVMARHAPDIAIHFGLRRSADAICVEQRAQNWKSGDPDAAGESLSSSPVLAGMPRLLHTPYLAERLVAHLKRHGLPARLSVDAGAYLCNMTYFLSLDRVHTGRNPHSAIFVHVPPIAASGDQAEGIALSQSQLRECALAVIGHALDEFRAVETRAPA